ncbi:MAG TPA: glycoside hydrolase family 9 protein [Cyclobacteriaceae bacterium]|nr:glycoside hydrolase family 9 protein [Cyclobacteriaceae bacterium]
MKTKRKFFTRPAMHRNRLNLSVNTCLYKFLFSFLFSLILFACSNAPDQALKVNELEYLEMPGLNVMLAHDFYPEGHQGGVGIIQNGLRVATNGDIRLEPTPGQWQPVPKVGERVVDLEKQEISVRMEYPDPEKNRKGFNPVEYPDLNFSYTLKVRPEGKSFHIIVDLDRPLPDEWIGRVGLNFEFFPGILFGKSFSMDDEFGIFPRQLNGPQFRDAQGNLQVQPMATGKELTIVPESDQQRMKIKVVNGGDLQLIDGRAQHNNGWFVVRALVPQGATANAMDWLVTPNAIPDWKYDPVVQVSQVGYHTKQKKIAIIETDRASAATSSARLLKISEAGGLENVLEAKPTDWGNFLRYRYLQFDFTQVTAPGMYMVAYENYKTQPFEVSDSVFKRNVWQPTLEYFLPVQMCHMRINDRYKVWHGFCHLDDARMAPVDLNHFDGYRQGSSTLCKYKPGESVPGLNAGGWHDAGDYDLRVESQSSTILGLTQIFELFKVDYDNTTINQADHIVELQVPDGKPDILQQIEHGALTIVGGYNSLGRLYRGIISPTLRQYVHLGDAINMTDNRNFSGNKSIPVGLPGSPDDRWVFTEENPRRELQVAAGLAAASRALKGFNDKLSGQCLDIALQLWDRTEEPNPLMRISLAVELLKTTNEKKYADFLVSNTSIICQQIERTGAVVGESLSLVNDKSYADSIHAAVAGLRAKIDEQEKKTPYGVPYEPNIWGAGWGIQAFGVQQYFLHKNFPDLFPNDYMLAAMNFVLGCHPGSNTSSFASGVGSRSITVAYGVNRDEWYYIPGGIGSGTALIRPDFPEMLEWPYLWQQTEYVLGGGTTDYLMLVLAADHLLN